MCQLDRHSQTELGGKMVKVMTKNKHLAAADRDQGLDSTDTLRTSFISLVREGADARAKAYEEKIVLRVNTFQKQGGLHATTGS